MATPLSAGSYIFGFGAGSSNREDLWDAITMISPVETPALSAAPRDRVSNVVTEWLTDALAAMATAISSGTSAGVEGDDWSSAYNTVTGRTRFANICQIFRRDIFVPDTQRAVDPAGVSDEYEWQVMKAGKELLRNIEGRLLTHVTASGNSATGASGDVRIFATLASTSSWTIPRSGVSGAITITHLNNLHRVVWNAGGNPDTLYVSGPTKAAFTVSAQVSGTSRIHNIAAADKRVIAVVNVFDGDFGVLNVVPSRQMNSGSASASGFKAWLIERQKLRLGMLRDMKHTPLGRTGDGTKGMVLTELTVKVMHASAHGYLDGLTDT
jgi:hypothetical protein